MRNIVMGLLMAGVCMAGAEVRGQLHLLEPVGIQQVKIEDEFWSPKRKVWRAVTIPDCLAKFEKDGAILNFEKVRDGTGAGTHGGPQWYDGLMYEMIRGCADFLVDQPDPELEKRLDGYIEVIAAAAAKDPDGYLMTWTQLKEPTHRWGMNGGDDNLQHDVYNAGAMIEGGVHYYRATGKTTLLKTATRLANHMCELIGPPPRKNVIPGHSLAEEALVELYRLFKEKPELKQACGVTGDEQKFLRLAEFFIENRGHYEGRKKFNAYGQDHKPVFDQESIEGHAVRATLMCAGVAALAPVNQRPEYLSSARRLWESFTSRKLYITGGAGATESGEAFAGDYELPNDGYLETCAAIGGAFFDHRMNLALGHAQYVDELERALYNSALAGVSHAGNTYSYVNPLQFERGHKRWGWHGCPCCPPMFLKIMGALPGYIYAQEKDGLYVNLFVGSTAKVNLAGQEVIVRQKTGYPWDGLVRLELQPKEPTPFALYVRVPGWTGRTGSEALYQASGGRAPKLKVNGRAVRKLEVVRGYARVERTWAGGDVVEVSMDMPVRRVRTHEKVKTNQGLVALARGPLVYALETTGPEFRGRNIFLPKRADVKAVFQPDLCGGVTVIQSECKVRGLRGEKARSVKLEAIPYFAYGNREQGDLRVWLPEVEEKAVAPTLANTAKATASHCWREDHLEAINDGVLPAKSSDNSKPRLSWWEHKGGTEWVQYEFAAPTKVSKARVFWFADRPVRGGCDLPETWRLLYRRDGKWVPVEGASGFGVEPDKFNETTFPEVKTTGVRAEVQLRAGWSGGVCEWEVE